MRKDYYYDNIIMSFFLGTSDYSTIIATGSRLPVALAIFLSQGSSAQTYGENSLKFLNGGVKSLFITANGMLCFLLLF